MKTHNTLLTLTGIIAAISFVLSYDVLVNVARLGQVSPNLSYFWPVIIDLPIVSGSLFAGLAVAAGQPRRKAWGIVFFASVASMGFNVWYHWGSVIAVLVGLTAPTMYLVSFEVFLWTIKLRQAGPVVQPASQTAPVVQALPDIAETTPDTYPPKLDKPSRLARVRELAGQGYHQPDIARLTGVSEKTTQRDLTELGIVLNGKGAVIAAN